jgi:DNA-binding IclR family transcriptional regulator
MEAPAVKVKSADRVLDILELFIGKQSSYSLTEISKILSMPPSSTHQILQNMLARGYLEMDETGKQFCLGYKLFEIRAEYTKNTDMKREFYRMADKISSELNEVVFLAIQSADKVLYIAEKQSSQALRLTANLGSVLPLYASASGKIFLADLLDEEVDVIYPEEQLDMLTEQTIPTRTLLKQQLADVRVDHIAYNWGESVEGLRCMAGAIRNTQGKAVASVSISIPEIRLTEEKWAQTLIWIKKSCEEISNRVFW